MDIQFNVNGEAVNAALAIPESGRGPGVLLLHPWWGLNAFIKGLAERFAQAGFVCLAPDLFKGETASMPEEAEALIGRHDDPAYIGSVVFTAKDYLKGHSAVSGEKIGAVGFSFGAPWVLELAAQSPEQIGAGVLFYGLWEVDFEKVRAPILGHFSDADEWEPYEQTQAVEKAMAAAGVDVVFHTYPGLAHWFMESDRPEYDHEAADCAWERTVVFLKVNLQAAK